MNWDDFYKAKTAIYMAVAGILGFDVLVAITVSIIVAVSIVCFELIFGGILWAAVLMEKNGWGLDDIF